MLVTTVADMTIGVKMQGKKYHFADYSSIKS